MQAQSVVIYLNSNADRFASYKNIGIRHGSNIFYSVLLFIKLKIKIKYKEEKQVENYLIFSNIEFSYLH